MNISNDSKCQSLRIFRSKKLVKGASATEKIIIRLELQAQLNSKLYLKTS